LLTVTQLCDMFTAGYSAKVTEKDQQGVSAFEDFAEGDLLAFDRGEGEGGGGGVYFEFHVSVSGVPVSSIRFRKWKVVSGVVSLSTFYVMFFFAHTTR
jgi:hypothetical protein